MVYFRNELFTCDDDGEAAGVQAFGDLLRRGRGPEPAGARLAGDERQDTHRRAPTEFSTPAKNDLNHPRPN